MIRFGNVSLRRGSKLLLQQVDFTLYAGWKVGITGGNGCGKSSLFDLIMGDLQVDQGDLTLPQKIEIAHVAQETPALRSSALDYVIDGDRGVREIE
ncbi:MAG: ATP-binding cassette domain-containing protein, partial [Candidatus Thiodiazotropha sp.]